MKSPPNIFVDLQQIDYLDETAIVGRTVRIRKPERVRIGAGSIIDDFTYISCALELGSYSHIGAGAAIIGGEAHVKIGHFVNMAPGARIIAASNDFRGGGLVGPTIPALYAAPSLIDDIVIGDHVLLGANVVVLPGVHIPEGVALGACTLLTAKMKLEPWTLYAGCPAQRMRKRDGNVMLEAARRLREDRPHDFPT